MTGLLEFAAAGAIVALEVAAAGLAAVLAVATIDWVAERRRRRRSTLILVEELHCHEEHRRS